MRSFRRRESLTVLGVVLGATAFILAQRDTSIPTPEQFFGFPMGAERKLVPLDAMYAYFSSIDDASDRVLVQEIGRTTMGKPMIMVVVSDPATIADLPRYQRMQRQLADPRVTTDEEAARIAREHKAILLVGTGQDSNEPSPPLMAIRLIHQLATDSSEWLDHVLKNVIILIIPLENPDGHQLIVDWHAKNLDTPYEGSELPELWHEYIGGDNNRDNYMQTQVETRHVNRVVYKEWLPDVYVNIHNMRADGPRIFVPPYKNPPNPNIDPLIFSEVNFYGQAMAAKLHEAGKSGVMWGERFEAYRQGTQMRSPLWRNAIGILCETAVSPWGITVVQDMAGPGRQTDPLSRAQPRAGTVRDPDRKIVRLPAPTDVQYRMNYPRPWRGGTWSLADAVEYQYLATIGLVEALANNREMRKRNFYLLNKRTIQRYAQGSPYAYIVPSGQRDPVAGATLLRLIQAGGAEVHRAEAPFTADDRSYPAGTHVVLLAQPFGRWVKDTLEPQVYPDIRWPFPTAPIDKPYDVAAWTLGMLMGVETIVVDQPFEGMLRLVRDDVTPDPRPKVGESPIYVLPHEMNGSFSAMNRLLKEGADVKWASQPVRINGRTHAPGAILVRRARRATLTKIVEELGVEVDSATDAMMPPALRIVAPRIAVYQPWGGDSEGATDAGWTRWVLEQHEFPYTRVRNADVRKPDLLGRFDVIVLPEMSRRPAGTPSLTELLVRGNRGGSAINLQSAATRPEYAEGIGDAGVDNLRTFVRQGGTLITLGNTAQFAIDHLGIPYTNVVVGLEEDAFFAPGSLLRLTVDTHHPIGYGMPEQVDAMFVYNGAYAPTASLSSVSSSAIARYPRGPLLRSGWIFGEEKVRGLAGVIETVVGKGRVIMHTFRVQFRGQTWATFKLLFNSLLYGPAIGRAETAAAPP